MLAFPFQFPGMPGGPEGALGMGPDGMPPVMNGELYSVLSLLNITC